MTGPATVGPGLRGRCRRVFPPRPSGSLRRGEGGGIKIDSVILCICRKPYLLHYKSRSPPSAARLTDERAPLRWCNACWETHVCYITTPCVLEWSFNDVTSCVCITMLNVMFMNASGLELGVAPAPAGWCRGSLALRMRRRSPQI